MKPESRYQHALTDMTFSAGMRRAIKSRKLSDGGGLHLLINPDGAKYWRLAYRWHGKQRTLALGVYPAVGLSRRARRAMMPSAALPPTSTPSVVKT